MENNKKYGVPLYSAGWVRNKVKGKAKIQDQDQDGDPDRSSGELSNAESQNYVVLAGGGGEGRSGIPNAVFIVLFDSATNALSNDPVRISYYSVLNFLYSFFYFLFSQLGFGLKSKRFS
jgi:prolactin regulatory element-binding protein